MSNLTPGADRFEPQALLKKSRYKMVTLVLDKSIRQPRVARLLRQPPGATEIGLLQGIAAQAEWLKSFRHPNVSRFDRVVEGAGGTWMLFDFEPGVVLSQYRSIESSIADEWIVWWLQQILTALHALHSHSPPYVLGYIEPSDIVIQDDRLFLVDLGLFEHIFPEIGALGQHAFVNFVAPEKRTSPQAAPAADLFSAGALAFWLCTGHAPVASGASGARRMRAVLAQYRPELPAEVSDLIVELLDYYPSKRPATARDAGSRLAPFVRPMTGRRPPDPSGDSEHQTAAVATRLIVDDQPPPPIFLEPTEEQPQPTVRTTPRMSVVHTYGIAIVATVAVIVLGSVVLHRTTGLGPARPAPPVRVTAGQVLQETSTAGARWKPVWQIGPGALMVVSSGRTATLDSGGSTLALGGGTMISMGGWDGTHYTFRISAGKLRAITGQQDRLDVGVPHGDVIQVRPSSDVTVDVAGGTVTCQAGSASLTWRTEVHEIPTGGHLSLDLGADQKT